MLRDGGLQLTEPPEDELKLFLLVLRRALLMLVHYINRRYNLK